jgi:hypothetical protein
MWQGKLTTTATTSAAVDMAAKWRQPDSLVFSSYGSHWPQTAYKEFTENPPCANSASLGTLAMKSDSKYVSVESNYTKDIRVFAACSPYAYIHIRTMTKPEVRQNDIRVWNKSKTYKYTQYKEYYSAKYYVLYTVLWTIFTHKIFNYKVKECIFLVLL